MLVRPRCALVVAASIMVITLLSGCAGVTDPEQMKGWSAARMYEAAKDAFDNGAWDKAIRIYERMEARYPYGRYAEQAQLDLAYAYWKSGEPPSGIAAIDRFLRLHPNHRTADYALYLKGLINFNQDSGLLSGLGGQDVADRDPAAARASFEAFRELAARYPKSRYRKDAVQRMTYLLNAMARGEVKVARYYMKRGAWLAAANRAQYAIKTYPEARESNKEALQIMIKAYDTLGLTELRDDAARVLKNNFPENENPNQDDKQAADKKSWWQFW